VSDAILVSLIGAACTFILGFIGTFMIRSSNALRRDVQEAKGQLNVLITEVALQGNNHGHVIERLSLVEQASRSAHQRIDALDPRVTRLEAWKDAGNPEIRPPHTTG
jgi:hypothetical protein